MEFGLDLIGSLRDRLGAAGSSAGADAPLLDWPSLHARLTAAYDVRRELMRSPNGSLQSQGSFDRGAATMLCGPGFTSYLVNPADLADGKDQSCIGADVAAPNVGDQGK